MAAPEGRLAENIVYFARALRAAGMPVGPGAVIGCTAFDAGEGKTPFVVDFDLGVAQVTSADGAGRALEEAAALAQRLKAS